MNTSYPTCALVPTLLYRAQRQSDLLTNAAVVFAGFVLLALAAQVEIPLPFTPVPLTGQTFAVLLIGAAMGSWRGALVTTFYLLGGSLGLPVFSGGASGFAHLVGPTGGYLVGFLVSATLLGYLTENSSIRSFFPAWILFTVGHIVIFGFGILWLSVWLGSFSAAIAGGLLPFLPGEILKSALAALALPAARRWLKA